MKMKMKIKVKISYYISSALFHYVLSDTGNKLF